MSMPWFRLYAEFAGDPVVQSLAFEDQRHYIVLLCLKCNGLLDRHIASSAQREQIIARGLGLDLVSASEAKRRLQEVGLIDKKWHPIAWDKRQFVSDVSTERVRKYRKLKESGNVSETENLRFGNAPDTEQIQNRTDNNYNVAVTPQPSVDGEKKNGHPTLTAQALEVLDFLNQKTKRNFRGLDGNNRPTVNLTLVIDRLKTGITTQDCKTVIARKHRDWSGDDKMRKYLRPSTLFRASNFEQYLGECVAE